LIWSPQEETDSLTGDELLSSYADLIQVDWWLIGQGHVWTWQLSV
jgi:hypothetical protein